MLGTSFLETEKSQPKSEWVLPTDKHYKIWFSSNPKEFLSVENRIRLIRFRLENPRAKISLVYSSKILSQEAQSELQVFFQKLSILSVDFDDEMPALLDHDYDKILYQIAQAEIAHALAEGGGGNLAAASDCIRLLPGLIEKCGIYSDLDVEICFDKLPEVIDLKSFVVFPCIVELEGNDIGNMSFNNEFLGFAHNNTTRKLAPEAIFSIRAAQLEVIQRYTQPTAALLSPVIRGLHTSVVLNPDLNKIVNWYISSSKDVSKITVFDLRKFINQLSIKDLYRALYPDEFEQRVATRTLSKDALSESLGACIREAFQLQKPELKIDVSDKQIAHNTLIRIRSMLYKASVTHLSGPFISTAFFEAELRDFDLRKAILSESTEEILRFANCIQNASLKGNGLFSFIKGQDVEHKGMPLSDEAWTPKGAARAALRSDEYLSAILRIQRFIRKRNVESENQKENVFVGTNTISNPRDSQYSL